MKKYFLYLIIVLIIGGTFYYIKEKPNLFRGENPCANLNQTECQNNNKCLAKFGSSSCRVDSNKNKLVCPHGKDAIFLPDMSYLGCLRK